MSLCQSALDTLIQTFKIRQVPSGLRWLGNKNLTTDSIQASWFDVTKVLKTENVDVSALDPNGVLKDITSYFVHKTKESLGDFRPYDNIEEYVADRVEELGIKIDSLGRVDLHASKNSIDQLYLDVHTYNETAKELGGKVLPAHLIDKVLDIVRFKRPKESREKILAKYEYSSQASDAGFTAIVDQLVPESRENNHLHALVLKHMVWQVKRKMLGKPILDPLMLYVSGLQGQGKSSVIRKIFGEPIGDLYSEQDIKDALDVRSAETKQSYYFLLIDEIHHLDSGTVSKLKKLLTSTSENSRILGTNAVMNVRNNLTVAATSNYDLMTTIYDESGMRRFWEIKLTIGEGKMVNWDELNKIDISELWKSVDENGPGYYGRHLTEFEDMREYQRKSVPRTYAEAFLYTQEHIGDSEESEGNLVWLKGSDLYKNYKNWSADNGVTNSAHNSIWFSKKLGQLGIKSKEINRDVYFLLLEGPQNNTSVPVVESDGVATGKFHKANSITRSE